MTSLLQYLRTFVLLSWIHELDEAIVSLAKVRVLNLSGNPIHALLENVAQCASLEKIDLPSLKKVDIRGTNCDLRNDLNYTELLDRGGAVKVGDQ